VTPLLTTSDAAQIAKVSRRTLNTWRRLHALPCLTLPGGAIRYCPEDFAAWLRDRGHNLTPHERDARRANDPGRAA